MHVISRKTLVMFWNQSKYADAEQPLRAWYDEAKHAKWRTTSDVKSAYGNASFIANNRVVFNIAGNKYRLIVAMNYEKQLCFVKFIGTHAAYDQVDAATVERLGK